ncbi:spermidine synthase [Gorillibacterium sp. sgz500922]|uniref:spermidine synthase n=1 Tax=Gorillibacterium sp. sgz500922 TaxID=3446694 RepID=UPI003F6764BB
MKVIAERREAGDAVTVAETEELYGQRGRFRLLCFADGAVQGALDLDRPERSVLEYPAAMVHLLKQNLEQPDRIFLIGLGTGAIPRLLPGCRVEAAEPSAAVVELGKAYFGCAAEPVFVEDGREALSRQPDGGFDAVIVDAFTSEGTPRHLLTREFFRLAADKLRPDGLLLLNRFGRGPQDPRIEAGAATLAEVFPETAVFALPGEGKAERNLLFAAGRRPIRWRERELAGFVPVRPFHGRILTDAPM